MAADNDISAQLDFLAEIDGLKTVVRQSLIADGSRRENSAEHSWHLAMFALVLSHQSPDLDLLVVVKMLLIHDLVEIDVGDAPIHANIADPAELAAKEAAAAKRIFGLLPPAQGEEMLKLWQEFESRATPEARFAKALDRLQPLLLNTLVGGGTWAENDVDEAQVVDRYGPTIEAGGRALWSEAKRRVEAHFARIPASEG